MNLETRLIVVAWLVVVALGLGGVLHWIWRSVWAS